MYYNVDVYDDNDVKLEFGEDCVVKAFERNISNSTSLNTEEKDIIMKAVNILHDKNIEINDVQAYVTNVEVDEDEIIAVCNNNDLNCNDSDTYDDGYDDAVDKIEQQNIYLKNVYGTLYYKLDKLVYHFGNPEPLTENEIRDIRNILDYKYRL